MRHFDRRNLLYLIPGIIKIDLWLGFVPIYQWIMDTFNYAPWQGWAWNHTGILGPYSIMWWIVYYLFTRTGYLMFGVYMAIVDTIILFYVKDIRKRYLYAFIGLSMFFFYADPIDLLIVWIGVLGFKKWYFSILAGLTKLPVGAPLYVWQFIFTDVNGSTASTGPFGLFFLSFGYSRYLILGGWILIPIIIRMSQLDFFSRLNKSILKDWRET